MKLFNESRPHIKSKDTTNIIMTDILIAMIFLVILSFLYFGSRALLIIFVSVVISYFLDLICVSIRKKAFSLPDISSIVTGTIIALLMPAKVPMYVVISSCVFGVLIAKQCFGGLGQNIFNPAAAGVAFSSLCWPDLMFIYPVPDIAVETGIMSESVCYILKLGAHPNISIIDMLLGKQPGPIGTVHILVIISCVMWLIIRKSIYWPKILSFVISCVTIAVIFPRIHSARFLSVVYELFSGSLLFGAVFMITDPVTAPKYNISKIFYGAIIGVLTMIFRYIGGFSQGICFSILIANSLSFSLDKIIYKYWNNINIFRLIKSRGDFSVKN